MAELDDYGITSIDTALTSKFTLKNSVQEGEVVLDEDGLFHHACCYGEEWMFDAEGFGDLPVDFALASDGPANGIAGVSGGVTVVDKAGRGQSTGNPNKWSANGEVAPDAVAAA